jgi:cysteine-rich repeat protein
MPRVFVGLCCMLACIYVACGGSGKKGNNVAGTGASGSGGTSTESQPISAGSPGGDIHSNNGGSISKSTIVCGDKKTEGGEECDDGNMDDSDGCTSLCTFTCHNNSDCESDPGSGTGATCDTKNTHTCTSVAGRKAIV